LSNPSPRDLVEKKGLNAFIAAFVKVCAKGNQWRRVHEQELDLENQGIDFFGHLHSYVNKKLVLEIDSLDGRGKEWELSPKLISGLELFIKMPVH
jgi:hypothetical protein